MQISSSHQMYVFLLCVALGIACGIFFDFQRSIRRLCFAGALRTTLEDILFAFICIAAVIALGFYFNSGQLRYYQIMGSVSGALFYAAFLTKAVMRFFSWVYRVIEKLLVKPVVRIFGIMCIPLRKLFTLGKRLWKKLAVLCSRFSRSIKNNRKRLKKRIKML